MKLLLDENLPKRLKLDFKNHEIYTVWDKGWNGKKNGELLRLMIDDNFTLYSLPIMRLFLMLPAAMFCICCFGFFDN
jgi:hypothetical protein